MILEVALIPFQLITHKVRHPSLNRSLGVIKRLEFSGLWFMVQGLVVLGFGV